MSVAKSARLPLEIIQGSVKDRYKNIQAANEKIFEQIMENPDDLSLKRLQSIAQDVFSPSNNKINVKIEELTDRREYIRGSSDTIEENGAIIGYNIQVRSKNGQLRKDHLPVFMHEVTHVLHHLFEPKILARELSIDKLPKKTQEQVEKYYYRVLHKIHLINFFNPLKARLGFKIITRNLNDQTKLNILKSHRYRLQMEYLANWETEKYEGRLVQRGISYESGEDMDKYMFIEKLEFLDKEIKKLLEKMRNK